MSDALTLLARALPQPRSAFISAFTRVSMSAAARLDAAAAPSAPLMTRRAVAAKTEVSAETLPVIDSTCVVICSTLASSTLTDARARVDLVDRRCRPADAVGALVDQRGRSGVTRSATSSKICASLVSA